MVQIGYNWQFEIAHQTIHSIVLLYYGSPFTLLILIHCKEKAENINKAWSNYMNMLISPVAQVR